MPLAPPPSLFHRAETLRHPDSAALRIADTPLRQGLPRLLAAALLCAPLASVGPAHAELVSPDQRISPIAGVENEPDVAVAGERLVAVWAHPASGGAVGWAFSGDGGSNWGPPGNLPPGTLGNSGATGQPTVCVDGVGWFFAAATFASNDGASVGVWRGTLVGTGLVWQSPVPVVPPELDAIFDTPRIASDPVRHYLYVSYTEGLGRLFFVRSLDQGQTWSVPLALNNTPTSSFARPAVGPDGELYVLSEDFSSQQIVGRKSTDFGANFEPPFVVAPILDDLNLPSPSWLGGHGNPVYPVIVSAPDGPSVAVDLSNSPNRGRVYATWTDHATGTLGPSLGYASEDEPNNFFANATPVQIGQDIRHFVYDGHSGYNDCDIFTFVGEAGATLWLSGEITSVSRPPPYSFASEGELYCGEDTTHLVRVGAVMMQPTYQGPLPAAIYTFPATTRYWLTIPCAGFTTMVMEVHTRTLTPGAGQAARDHRDVVLVSSGDGGATWSPKVRVNDDPPRYDNTFPEVAVDALGQVHVAWYDRRDDDTPCGTHVNTYWTVSRDGGATFSPSQRLSRRSSAWECRPQTADKRIIGDHLALKAEGTQVYALWTQAECPDSVDIFAVRIDGDDPTAIAVSGPDAELQGSHVRVTWEVADASRIAGFSLWRAEGASDGYSRVSPAPIPVAGTGAYAAIDPTPQPGLTYLYKLEVSWTDGSTSRLGPVSVLVPSLPARTTWAASGPNPFSWSVSLTLSTAHAGEADVRVFDVAGHEVSRLLRGHVEAGTNVLRWDARSRQGQFVRPGVYVVRAVVGKEVAQRTIVYLR